MLFNPKKIIDFVLLLKLKKLFIYYLNYAQKQIFVLILYESKIKKDENSPVIIK